MMKYEDDTGSSLAIIVLLFYLPKGTLRKISSCVTLTGVTLSGEPGISGFLLLRCRNRTELDIATCGSFSADAAGRISCP